MEKLQITPASQWRNRHTMRLPSGMVGEFRKIDLMSLIMQSSAEEVPNFLRIQVVEQLNNPGKEMGESRWTVTADNLGELNKLITLFVKGSFITPAIVPVANYDANQIEIGDVSMEDRLFLFNWSMPKEVGQAATFLSGSGTDVASASPVQPVRQATLEGAGSPELVGLLDAG